MKSREHLRKPPDTGNSYVIRMFINECSNAEVHIVRQSSFSDDHFVAQFVDKELDAKYGHIIIADFEILKVVPKFTKISNDHFEM